MALGLLILRVVIGALFVAHGTQKLFGWFGGYGIDGTSGFMGQLRYRQPRLAAVSAGVFEAGAGLFLAFGFLTPLAAAAIVGVMINATVSAKLSQGFFGGWELDALYGVGALALAFTGAGTYSVDNALGLELNGARWGLIALGLAVVIGALVLSTRVPQETVVEQAAAGAQGERRAA